MTARQYTYTDYFEQVVLKRRPYLKKAWCIQVIEDPVRVERQDDNRVRFWGRVAGLDDRMLRVVTLADRLTIHNAFPDRSFRP